MKYLDTKEHKLGLLLVAVAIFLLVWACSFVINNVYIEQTDSVTGEQVLYARAGEEVIFKFDGTISIDGDASDETFIIAFLAPTSWNVAQNATVTYTEDKYQPDVEQSMTVIPDATSPANYSGMTWGEALKSKYGVMSNVLSDMEWVAFQSSSYSTVNGTINFTVTIKCNAGTNNLRFKPAFFINHSSDGLGSDNAHYATAEGECFEVIEGNGATTDFCAYHYYAITPLQSLQNDYVTFTFQGDISSNDLTNYSEIYWKGTAYTDAGKEYAGEKTLMTKQSGNLPRYDVTIWPAGFFDIPAGETITYIEYIFTNSDGSVSITQSDDDRDNSGEDVAEGAKEPFTFELRCD